MRNSRKNFARTAIASLMAAVSLLSVILTGCRSGEEATAIGTAQTSQGLQSFEFPDFEPQWGVMYFPGEYNKEKDVRVEYAYSDRYFDYASTIYNPSLATMSLCLELSSWASYETDIWEEKTRNAQKLLDEIGFVDFAQNEFWNDKPTTESIGVVAAHKTLEDSTLIALPIRGGKYYNEWGGNVALGLTGAHTGFAESRDNVIRFLEEYIISHDITGRVKIWVVGYSRGGAVANLVAGYLNGHALPNGATLALEDLYCYAFEPPQGAMMEEVGNDADHANIHNIVNPNDIVPMVAPADWEFARYNTTARLIPTVTTAQFEAARDTMLEEFAEILEGVELTDPEAAVYNVSEYAKKLEVKVDIMNFLPSGDPLLEIRVVDDTSQTMNEVLTRFISSFAASVRSREEYNTSLEADLVHLLDLLMGYEAKLDLEQVMDTVMEAMTANNYENLKYILTPAVQLGDATTQERVEQVVARLREVLPQPEGFTDLYGTAGTLIQAVGTMLVDHTEELLDIVLAFTSSKVMQSHHEEVTLAWMRAGDRHYTDTPYTMAVPQTLRTVQVNCPADVRVYDSKGELVASVIDGVCTTYNDVVGCAINGSGEIILHLPSDEQYQVESTATDEGSASITLSEYNIVHSAVTRVQNYTDIPLTAGETLVLEAPTVAAEELTDEAHQGSAAEYRLMNDEGTEIPCEREDRGEEVTYFTVSVGRNSEFGLVSGGGQYLDGSFAQVVAQPMAGSTFDGWYVQGTLVSGEPVYRFAVEEDVSLAAHFTQAEQYQVSFSISGQGAVANADRTYTAGSMVQLSATPGPDYVFDHWETTSGSIVDRLSPQTVLVVEEGDATVTAVFRPILCVNCGEHLTDGQTHSAVCGQEEHYTCDDRSHHMCNCGHYACEAGDHSAGACGTAGHYNCIGNHGAPGCAVSGHAVCDGRDHTTKRACGHPVCVEGDHSSVLACNHYACATGDHSAGACGTAGHYNCGGAHGMMPCGQHYICDSSISKVNCIPCLLCGRPKCNNPEGHGVGKCFGSFM